MIALAQVVAPVLPVAARRDPVARAYGWPALAAAADRASRRLGGGDGTSVWLGADRFQDAAELSLLVPRQPTVFALNLGGRPNQYDLWPGFAESARRGDALVAALDTGTGGADVAARLQPHFDAANRDTAVALMRGRDTIAVRAIWTFRGWHGTWPRKSPGRR